jgi:lipooligosaccharide transport system ATP-binding protein
VIAEHSTREVTELRFGLAGEGAADGDHSALAEKVADPGGRVEVLPDRLLVYSPDGDEVATKVHERGPGPVAVLVRRSTLEDVFLQPHRPDPGGLMASPRPRVFRSPRASPVRSTTG